MRVVALVILFAVRVVSADPGTAAPPPDQKSEQTAVVLSLSTGVLLPLALVGATRSGGSIALGYATAGAIILGPASGHWYAGEAGGWGIGLRFLGTAAAVSGFLVAANSDCEDQSCTDSSDRAAYIALGGAALVVGSTIYDIATAGAAARRYNASHIVVAPAPMSTGGPPGLGLAIGGTF